ncbi:YdcF family protein [Consotaella aegiceratis]|uniref:YdcF family protein n=1 Tax=Consotaella aegiceratis TaxID=3097961 RepID=UPI002F3F50F1
MAWNDAHILEPLAVIWDYMRLVHPPVAADAILALGSFDPHVAVRAADLWTQGFAPRVIMSGGLAHRGGLLDTGWNRPEAEVFAAIAREQGVPGEAILIEDRAQNTGENFALARRTAEAGGLVLERLLVVAKPYMTRRAFATGRKVWPEARLTMQCEDIAMTAYLAREAEPERTVQAMVGDLHRIMIYPGFGFQIPQDVPPTVIDACTALVSASYGQRLVPGHKIEGA